MSDCFKSPWSLAFSGTYYVNYIFQYLISRTLITTILDSDKYDLVWCLVYCFKKVLQLVVITATLSCLPSKLQYLEINKEIKCISVKDIMWFGLTKLSDVKKWASHKIINSTWTRCTFEWPCCSSRPRRTTMRWSREHLMNGRTHWDEYSRGRLVGRSSSRRHRFRFPLLSNRGHNARSHTVEDQAEWRDTDQDWPRMTRLFNSPKAKHQHLRRSRCL